MEAGPVSAVVGRFAPSPSGRLHLGNLACSLLAWLSARSRGGRIVLRIEDLDAERCPRKYADQLEKDLGFSNGYVGQLKKGSFPAERLSKIADYLSLSPQYLMYGEEPAPDPVLTSRDERDIEKILARTKEQLLSQEGLMFDGDPASPEAIDSILSAMQIGMELAKKKNKEKYTPKKYKKD